MSSDGDHTAIVAAALDYFEGWFDGDAGRLGRALLPELAKRGPKRTVPNELMVAWTEAGEGKAEDPGPDRRIDVTVADVYEDIASAVVDSDVYREYLQLVRADDGWQVIDALWRSA
ncbi:MAG TPA: nuclear transport factor 2 family protein [Gaiellaceae bacterium]|nr:nuclear transport factor 2 family protein [Gaiellaceae bacterium]